MLNNFEPPDLIVLILTFILLFFFISFAVKAIMLGIEIEPDRSKLISHILSSILTTISLYLGYRLKNKGDK